MFGIRVANSSLAHHSPSSGASVPEIVLNFLADILVRCLVTTNLIESPIGITEATNGASRVLKLVYLPIAHDVFI